MLRRNWFHILLALAERDLHGSAIAEDVLERTHGELRLWPATLYRALDELAEEGLAAPLADDERPEGESRRKQYYCITSEGRRRLAEEAGRLAELAQVAKERLGDVGA